MMRFGKLCLLMLALGAGMMELNAGEIEGIVENEFSTPVAGITVLLKDEHGRVQVERTDARGTFSFPNLGPGLYEVRIDPPVGMLISRPCSVEEVALSTKEIVSLSFRVITTGVSVDFGKPASGGTHSLVTKPPPNPYDEPFSMALRLGGFSDNGFFPESLVLVGRFHKPGYVDVEIDQVFIGDSYLIETTSAGNVYLPDGFFQITVTSTEEPYLSHDGDVLIIKGRVQSIDGQWLSRNHNQLCLCIKKLEFFSGDESLDDPELRAFAQPWSECVAVQPM